MTIYTLLVNLKTNHGIIPMGKVFDDSVDEIPDYIRNNVRYPSIIQVNKAPEVPENTGEPATTPEKDSGLVITGDPEFEENNDLPVIPETPDTPAVVTPTEPPAIPGKRKLKAKK